MKLRLLVSLVGNGISLSRGQETEFYTGENAKALIAAGYAEAVSQLAKGSKAAAPRKDEQPENRQ